LEHISLGL